MTSKSNLPWEESVEKARMAVSKSFEGRMEAAAASFEQVPKAGKAAHGHTLSEFALQVGIGYSSLTDYREVWDWLGRDHLPHMRKSYSVARAAKRSGRWETGKEFVAFAAENPEAARTVESLRDYLGKAQTNTGKVAKAAAEEKREPSDLAESVEATEKVGDLWVYILGERSGEDIKIGYTASETMASRLQSVEKEQTTNSEYLLLAAVRGDRKDERYLKEYFSKHQRTDKGAKTEYFNPDPELMEYAAWLRSRWWASVDPSARRADYPSEDPGHWYPQPERRYRKPEDDPSKLVQDYAAAGGALPGPWSWFPNPTQSFQDYFTPSEIIHAAREAMGGIDLDAASHWAANREHQIPDYFDAGRSAFQHDWHGRVWLNPPYGNNGPWFDRAVEFIESGEVTQMCMLSPMWAFNTAIAADFMGFVSAMCILSPTPKFWGNAGGKTGTNQPHAVVYVGDRIGEFRRAFSRHGIFGRLESEVAA